MLTGLFVLGFASYRKQNKDGALAAA
jgi:hypothetical protein